MKKQHIICLGVIFCFLSCLKEVGKKPYELILKLDTGEVISIEYLIYEKPKKYEGEDGEDIYIHKVYDRLALVSSNSSLPNELDFSLLKTESNYLIGLTSIQNIFISDASFASSQNVNLLGSINFNGAFKKNGRKYSVENGTFTIDWTNAADYGEPVQELTGTWSLKRK